MSCAPGAPITLGTARRALASSGARTRTRAMRPTSKANSFTAGTCFRAGSGCELAHTGRPRCDGHHRTARNFLPAGNYRPREPADAGEALGDALAAVAWATEDARARSGQVGQPG